MLISFVGSPCSGKTTTSAMLFAKLKEAGASVENVQEYARLYIATKRLQFKKQGQKFSVSDLKDEDQWTIMQKQFEWEATLDLSLADVPVSLVVSDTSSLNSLLYMTPAKRNYPEVRAMTRRVVEQSALIFYCKPVDLPAYVKAQDPNRVHSQAQSEVIDREIPEILKGSGVDTYTLLVGSMESRLARAFQAVNARLSLLAARAIKADEAREARVAT